MKMDMKLFFVAAVILMTVPVVSTAQTQKAGSFVAGKNEFY